MTINYTHPGKIARSKKEAVELGLKALIQLKKQEALKGFRGKLKWRGDLDRMRTD